LPGRSLGEGGSGPAGLPLDDAFAIATQIINLSPDPAEAPQTGPTHGRTAGAHGGLDDVTRQEYLQCIYMAASTQIAKWGNSLGLRLPKSVALEAQLDEGDTVTVSVRNGAIVVRPTRPTYSLDALVAKMTPRNRHHETDWGAAPVGRELW
jgi:antitoxin MazE